MKHQPLFPKLWLLCVMFVVATFSLTHSALSAVISYQGRMLVEGEKFNGTGEFKFALVDAGSENSVQATATATVTGGFITSISVGDAGVGYVDPPTVTITDGSGVGATATASVAGGMVTSITVNSAGSGYSATPTVTIDPPPSDLDYITFWSNDGSSVDGSEPTDPVLVLVNDGLFMVPLGDDTLANMTLIPSSVLDNDGVHLRIWFNDGVNGFAQLNADQALTAAPYAINAEVAGGVEWANISGAPAEIADGNDAVDDADASPTNEIQSISLDSNILSLSLGGGSANLSAIATPWQSSGPNLYFNAGNVGIGDNSPLATLSVGDGDKLQIHGNDGDVVFNDDEGSIRFATVNGNSAPMIQMFTSGTFNSNRMVIAHSPSFSTWGLRYDDTPDQFNFIGDNLPVLSVQLSGQQRIGVGTFSPEAKLHVEGNSATGNGHIKLTETQFDFARITLNNTEFDNYWDIAARSSTNLADAQFNIFNSAAGDILSVNARGRVGINDATPAYTMEIDGNENTRIINGYNELPTTTSTTYNYGVRMSLSQQANTGFPRLYNFYGISTDTDAYLSYGLYGYASGASSQNYGVYAFAPTANGYAGYFSGNVYATGTYLPSDRKLKTNINSYSDGLAKVMALRPITSSYKIESYSEMNLMPGEQHGFVADEVAAVMPELVKRSFHPYDEAKSDTPEGQGVEFDAVNYTGMIPVLVSAIQEQQQLINELRAEITALRSGNPK